MDGTVNGVECEPCNVTITVNKFSNIIPSDFVDRETSQINMMTNDPITASTPSSTSTDLLNDCVLSETTNVDDIVAMFNEFDVEQFSGNFYAADTPVNNPVNNLVNTPVNNLINAPVNNLVHNPVNNLINTPVNNQVNYPVNYLVNTPESNLVNTPLNNSVNSPVNNLVNTPVANTEQPQVIDAQMFQANEKISKVLNASCSFDTINDAQVLKHRLRTIEIEKLALMVDHNNLIREFNDSVESHLEEIRNLNDMNENYDREIHELRDLTCFLDDERNKYKKMAKEWQKFGRHMVAVMRTEMSSYQKKMLALENKQKSLIAENMELRDLCVHLDRQRSTKEPNDSSIKLMVCSECSALETPKSSNKWKNSSKMKPSGVNHRQTTPNGSDSSQKSSQEPSKKPTQERPQKPSPEPQILSPIEKEKDELRKLLLFRGDSKAEKKKVKFDFPDDSDSSTTSDVEASEFPTRLSDLDRKSKLGKLGKMFPLLDTSDGDITPSNEDCTPPPKPNILKKFDEENLSSDHLFFPTSPRKSLPKSQDSFEEDSGSRIEQLKSEFNDSGTAASTRTKGKTNNVELPKPTKGKSKSIGSKTTTDIGNIFDRNYNKDPFDEVDRNQEYI